MQVTRVCHLQLSVDLGQKMFTQSTRHWIGSASVTHVKFSGCLGKHFDTITSRALQVIQMSV